MTDRQIMEEVEKAIVIGRNRERVDAIFITQDFFANEIDRAKGDSAKYDELMDMRNRLCNRLKENKNE